MEELQNASSERVFDSLPTLSTGSEEFDGSGELEECLLKLLHCGKCGRKLGVKCVGAPDEKVHHRCVQISFVGSTTYGTFANATAGITASLRTAESACERLET